MVKIDAFFQRQNSVNKTQQQKYTDAAGDPMLDASKRSSCLTGTADNNDLCMEADQLAFSGVRGPAVALNGHNGQVLYCSFCILFVSSRTVILAFLQEVYWKSISLVSSFFGRLVRLLLAMGEFTSLCHWQRPQTSVNHLLRVNQLRHLQQLPTPSQEQKPQLFWSP
jgi:hypothetical protein